jgi:hypothetical protein
MGETYMRRKSFVIYEEMRKYLLIYEDSRRPLVKYDLATTPFWISLYMGKFFVTFLSVRSVVEKGFIEENRGIDPHHIHS